MVDANFDTLPRFDARDFQPPAWATSSDFAWGHDKPGESSRISPDSNRFNSKDSDAGSGDDDEHEDWADAIDGGTFFQVEDMSIEELEISLEKGLTLKNSGNSFFTAKPPNIAAALNAYQKAEALMALCPIRKEKTEAEVPAPLHSGLQEVTDEEASAIQATTTARAEEKSEAASKREKLIEDIRECLKACYGNQAACHIARSEDKEAVDACKKALDIDPYYCKALQRRASANERIGTWSSLTSAQEDYTLLLKLLPPNSPNVVLARRALVTLPERIRLQQEKEKDEMLGKLKELGNGLLGKFGLSTDMFKFDQQEGGGYNMRFER